MAALPEKTSRESATPSPTNEKAAVDVNNNHEELDVPVITKDGFRMHPQPTSDPHDPLNWSRWKKNSILAIVMAL